jgi:heat shock protein HtpX
MFTRIALFILTNIAVLAVAALVLNLLGVDRMVMDAAGEYALNYTGLFIFCAIFGFGGAFVSLFLSKWMAKRATRTQIIDAPSNPTEVWLLDTTRQLARNAGIETPEVGIFPAPEPNAFATGARRNKSLVAVSEGLLRHMRRDEVRAVLGHEIGHVANGDMVTLTLIQGVLNTFVIFLSRVIGYVVDRALHRDGEGGYGMGYFVTVIVTQLLLGILASMVVSWYSRRREYRADAGGAYLAGRGNMIGALEALQRSVEPEHMPEQLEAMGISGVRKGGLRRLFASHPPIEDRIAALREERHAAGS